MTDETTIPSTDPLTPQQAQEPALIKVSSGKVFTIPNPGTLDDDQLFGANRRPTGQRGWYAHFPHGKFRGQPGAFRMLDVVERSLMRGPDIQGYFQQGSRDAVLTFARYLDPVRSAERMNVLLFGRPSAESRRRNTHV